MFKKTYLALLISCFSVSSYAYIIGTNFTIENKTDMLLLMEVDQPHSRSDKFLELPPHQESTIYLENDDYTGYLNQAASRSFTIMNLVNTEYAETKTFVQGRISFFLGASIWNKYTFLDSISVAKGLTVNPLYTCENGGNNTLKNKLIIEGNPEDGIVEREITGEAICNGLKSSEFNAETKSYTVTCSNDTQATTFTPNVTPYCYGPGAICQDRAGYTDGKREYYPERSENADEMHANLDKEIGNSFCKSWGYKDNSYILPN